MKPTLFIFGRTPKLSFLELTSMYGPATVVAQDVALVETDVDPMAAMDTLGGTVKIARVVGELTEPDTATLAGIVRDTAVDNHITFGISAYGGLRLPAHVSPEVKTELVGQGYSVRYVETDRADALSSVVVRKQQAVEIVLVKTTDNRILAGVTLAVQDFEQWNKRDFGRPAPDPKAGMLPPKVARMIANIALGPRQKGTIPMLMDPFCGVGTVLAEGLLLGASVTGVDTSEDAVARSKKNTEWLRANYDQVRPLYANIIEGDATHVSQYLAHDSVDAVATEPFMGETVDARKANELQPDRVKNVLKGLEKLYIGALKEWNHVLKNDARIVMAMPVYMTPRGEMRVKNVVDRAIGLGYTLIAGPIEYSRPQAVVKREFFVFQKTANA